jgi:Protein of unknown function (DUF3078)
MRKIIIGIFALFSIHLVHAQDKTQQDLRNESSRTIKKDPNDTIPKLWKTGGLLRFTFTQGAQSNWSAGGENNTLGLSSFFSGYAFYKKGKKAWDNTVDLAFGFLNTTSLGSRKTDDRIDLLSKYGYELGKKWYLAGLVNFRTQFAPGYNYPTMGNPVLTSDFMAPGYLIVSPGFNYKPNDEFSFFISPATLRWTFVENDSLSAKGSYGVDTGKNVKLEFGAYSTITYTHKISSTTIYSGRLDLFSNYENKPQNVDVNWTNLLAVKVTGIITMTLSFTLIYDNEVSTVNPNGTSGGPSPQIQELLGIGVSLKL